MRFRKTVSSQTQMCREELYIEERYKQKDKGDDNLQESSPKEILQRGKNTVRKVRN